MGEFPTLPAWTWATYVAPMKTKSKFGKLDDWFEAVAAWLSRLWHRHPRTSGAAPEGRL